MLLLFVKMNAPNRKNISRINKSYTNIKEYSKFKELLLLLWYINIHTRAQTNSLMVKKDWEALVNYVTESVV